MAHLLRDPAVHADVVRSARGTRSVTLMRGPRFGNPDPNARVRAEEGHGQDPRGRWPEKDRRGRIRRCRDGWLESDRVVRSPREDGRMDRREETLRRHVDEDGRRGPHRHGYDQGVQHVPREGDRLDGEGAEQAGAGSREARRGLTDQRSGSRSKNWKGCGRALGLAEERTQACGRLFLGDFLLFLLFLFLLLFFLLGGRRWHRGGGRAPGSGPWGLGPGPALQRTRDRVLARLVVPPPRRPEEPL